MLSYVPGEFLLPCPLGVIEYMAGLAHGMGISLHMGIGGPLFWIVGGWIY
jgi:hypothetical protein